MSFKIGNNISSIKINGHYIKEAKLNGSIVYKLKDEETTHYTIDETWSYSVNGTVDGTLTRDNLDVWVTGTKIEQQLQGVAIEFTTVGTHNLKATFEFTGYEGCPRYQTCYIINIVDGSIYEFTMYFDDAGTSFTRTINQVLESGTYELALGSWNNIDFGLKCTELSLSTEIPQNLFDLSSYSFPITKGGLTFNYDDTNKVLSINGTSNDDFGLYIPLVLTAGNYSFSYLANQSDYGFYISIDNSSTTMLDGFGKNNKTFDLTSSPSQLILWFDTGYTYNNLELSFNLVKNHDLP